MGSRRGLRRSRARGQGKGRASNSTLADKEVVEAFRRVLVQRVEPHPRFDPHDLRTLLSTLTFAWFRHAAEVGDARELKIADVLHRLDAAAATPESRLRCGGLAAEPDAGTDEWLDKTARTAALTPPRLLWSECRRFLCKVAEQIVLGEQRQRELIKRSPVETIAEMWLDAVANPLPEHRDVLRQHAPRIRFANEGPVDAATKQAVIAQLARAILPVDVLLLEAPRLPKKIDPEAVVAAGLRGLGCDTTDLFQFAAKADKRAAVK